MEQIIILGHGALRHQERHHIAPDLGREWIELGHPARAFRDAGGRIRLLRAVGSPTSACL